MTSISARPEFPPGAEPPQPTRADVARRWLVPLGFLAPALFFLGIWVVYPTIRTMIRSLYSDAGGDFVGLENYDRMFSDDIIFTAIKNNFLWVLIVPALVTAVGLMFAVLTERVRWSIAFKVAVFIPLAISLFAVGVIWRIMYQQDPDRGVINAAVKSVKEATGESGVLSQARPSTEDLEGTPQQGFVLNETLGPGDTALLGLTAIRAPEVPADAPQAVEPEATDRGIAGVVWRDFKPGGGTPGELEEGEVGLDAVTIELRDASGEVVDTTRSNADGSWSFERVDEGEYRVGVGSATFVEPFRGYNFLGEKLITPAIMFSFIWVSAGFAMVIIGAGLAAIPRDVLEAARTDGASEWQVFRRVTVPLLAPVLTVVFVTQIISVLKIFDLILAIAPGSSQDDATTLAFEMWKRSFSGQNLFGLGSAIATFLFLLFIPFLVVNVRRFRTEA